MGWFEDYLCTRTQCVHMNGVTSDKLIVSSGVPQGSVLGPLFFVNYVNEACENLVDVKAHLYADDTIMYSSAPTITEAVSKLQIALNTSQNNLMKLKLDLNTNKTKLMFSLNLKLNALPSLKL